MKRIEERIEKMKEIEEKIKEFVLNDSFIKEEDFIKFSCLTEQEKEFLNKNTKMKNFSIMHKFNHRISLCINFNNIFNEWQFIENIEISRHDKEWVPIEKIKKDNIINCIEKFFSDTIEKMRISVRNFTPHVINLKIDGEFVEIPPEKNPIRVKVIKTIEPNSILGGRIDRVFISSDARDEEGDLNINLPEKIQGGIIIVSKIVMDAIKEDNDLFRERTDIFCIGETVRNEQNIICGATSLTRS